MVGNLSSNKGKGEQVRRLVLLTAGGVLILSGQPALAVPSVPMSPSNPPPATSWWFANSPGPGSIVGVRRHGKKIQFVDNWAPCFTGLRVRPYVYKGGGLNQNAYYSKQKMKIWVEQGKLNAKHAFIGDERLPEAQVLRYKRITAAKAKRLLVPVGVPPSKYFADCRA